MMKIKLLKDGSPKVYAATVNNKTQASDLITFLTELKDKKVDIVLNGHLQKLSSSLIKAKWLDGFKAYHNLNTKIEDLPIKTQTDSNLNQREASLAETIKSWEDRIVELEDTCATLRKIIDKQ